MCFLKACLFTVTIHLLATPVPSTGATGQADPHGLTRTFYPVDMAGQKQYALKGRRQFIRWWVHQRIRSFVCVRLCVSSERSERVANFHSRVYMRRMPITGAMAMKSLSL